MNPDRPITELERRIAEAICASLRENDPSGYVGDPLGRDSLIEGHFNMQAVSRSLLAKLGPGELVVHGIERVVNSVPD